MSLVTNVILSLPMCCEDKSEAINQWLLDRGHKRPMPNLGEHGEAYGGYKALEADVYVGAFNYLETDEFVAFIRALPWEVDHYGHREFDEAQLFVREQNDNVFRELLHAPATITLIED